ncbi:hypothetical protein BH11GEM1_BH11GEM1_29430 [soil metagenome]
MNPKDSRRSARALLVMIGITACSSATQQPIASSATPAAAVAVRSAPPRSEADVQFMSGMIPHHAQAVLIAGWAATHDARSDIRILSERIVVGQKDEIALMQYWLREHGEAVPAADATHMKMKMNGMEHDMLMPGMLNADQLARLDKARGAEFDRLFLEAMIGHHEGAITMVDELLGSTHAGQDDVVYRMASDVYADQTTEIERMKKMLATVPAGGSR